VRPPSGTVARSIAKPVLGWPARVRHSCTSETSTACGCGSPGKPGRRRAAATLGAESLTAREQEVVALAVEGLTAKAIGQRLHIGERTVETHLAHAYAKLGVRSRWELARSLPPP
jgi:DNA-binding NarL/FixJ family response regulator